jgi:hypothetical protein
MDAFSNSLGLTLIYLALLVVGIVYAVLILIGGAFSDLHLPGLDVDAGSVHVDFGGVDHPEVNVPSLSPVTLASFVTAFGAFGLIALGLINTTPAWSLAWAVGGAVAVAGIAHFAFGYFLIRPQGSSEVQLKDIIGAVGEVTVPIPEDGLGEITFVAQGGRRTFPARAAGGAALKRGATVVIDQLVGGTVLVRPQG